MFRLIQTFAVVTALGLAAGCSSGADVDEASVAGARQKKAAGPAFWVDPDSPAARQGRLWQRQGRAADAELLQRIAGQPAALWPAGEIDPTPLVRRATRAAAEAGQRVLLTAYNIPHRDCGQHSAGGAADADAYREWIGRFADAIGDAEAVVVLEPDAVAHIVDGCTPRELHAERERLLGEAISRLKAQPRTEVYLDAGNPAWITDPYALVEPLERAGIEGADGFALNVSNFQTTEDTTAYGKKLSERLGGKHFVIDTSRNGNGPLPGVWCNPPGRALGTRPTTDTGDPVVDAYLWIKRPGESDGTCEGGPAAGRWWPEYALGLARNAGA
ncbi:glycoside hydrolase family 6 protein [Streptomyces griseoviridis]|jgi:endoglucanase|uniref:Glucanase n=3 Tax=Streptomyces TaxID=1883 RepID=A0A918LBZ7_STRGD|nr:MULTISPECIES: glycoside hydrolase family 6 protein [Streptomyces]MDP9684156.1 endoglucanase [Streptomyces griseoviridis]GGS27889.1 glucanase [Streptomyces niveoruber]GGS83944.1 glucanase [Streptomyces griseoviridis]GGU45147.1 glucanase [Streptomyces daghestanicus]GHI30894.1 glucanase [Streptomyces daghestanicus]